MDIIFKLKFIKKHWKEGVHLLFKTKRFGVNNRWKSDFNSMFGWSTSKIIISIIKIRPIIENYKEMKFRAAGCHFLPEKINKKLGWYKHWKREKEDISDAESIMSVLY